MKKILCLLLTLMVYFQTFAVPAYPYPVTVTQPNGEELTLIMKGDEYIHWAVTLDGYTLLVNADRYFCYAELNASGDLDVSSHVATEISNRSPEVNAWLQNMNKNLFYSEKQVFSYMQVREIVDAEYEKTARGEIRGVRKLLVVLTEFPDRPMKRTQEDFNMLFNQINYTEDGFSGSVKDFYFENSYNTLEMQYTVVGPFVTPNNASYYTPDSRWSIFARHSITAAYNAGVNLAEFATGNTISEFYAIYAGYDQSAGCADCIWAHAFSTFNFSIGGYTISKYACSSELRGTSGSAITDIGTPCHEFGHSLGAPDYYDTDYATGGQYDGTGYWDLQSSGSYNNSGKTPALSNSRSKIYTYGWANAITLNSPQTVTVPSSRIYNNAFFRIDIPNSDSYCTQQYYLIENKIKEGFEAYIPGQNLLIYRCTENYNNTSNYPQNTTSWQRFYPVAANATVAVPTAGTTSQKTYGSTSSASCTWPGTGNKTTFNNTTTPATVSWDGTPINKPITNITVHGDYITFDFMGGGTKSNYNVFLPAYYGCMVTAQAGSTSPVNTGGNFSFKVDKLPSHSNAKIKVTANNIELTPSGNIYTISNIQADQIVRIEDLAFNTFPIVVTSGANGTIDPEGTVQVNHGGMKTFEIRADNGYSIDKVTIDGVDMGDISSYTFKNVLESHTLSATFKRGEKYPIIISTTSASFEATEGQFSDSVLVTVSQGTPALVANVNVTAPPRFQISNNGIKWYQAFSISKTQLPSTLYIRFNPAVGDHGIFTDTLTLKSTDAYNEIILTGNALVGIDEIDYQNIAIYPNPTTGNLTIESGELKITNIEIYDIYGRKQISDIRYPISDIGKSEINIAHLSAGIYFVAVNTDKGKVYKKIVKE